MYLICSLPTIMVSRHYHSMAKIMNLSHTFFPVETGRHVRTSSRQKTGRIQPGSAIALIIVFQLVGLSFTRLFTFSQLTFASDISTLSRMTGKDFSGPVPEIRAPPPQTVPPIPASEVEPQNSVPKEPEVSAKQMKKRSRSKSQGISDGDAVVIGDVDGFQSS